MALSVSAIIGIVVWRTAREKLCVRFQWRFLRSCGRVGRKIRKGFGFGFGLLSLRSADWCYDGFENEAMMMMYLWLWTERLWEGACSHIQTRDTYSKVNTGLCTHVHTYTWREIDKHTRPPLIHTDSHTRVKQKPFLTRKTVWMQRYTLAFGDEYTHLNMPKHIWCNNWGWRVLGQTKKIESITHTHAHTHTHTHTYTHTHTHTHIYIWYTGVGERFIGWKFYVTLYLLLITFWPMNSKQCNTNGRSVWTTMWTMLKNKPHLVTFHESMYLGKPMNFSADPCIYVVDLPHFGCPSFMDFLME